MKDTFRMYNELCDSCINYDDCVKKNACMKCKNIYLCDKFKEYSNEYYNIFEHDKDEELLTMKELKDVFTHDYDPKFCTHFNCEEYEMTDEEKRRLEKERKDDEYLKYFR